METIGSTKITGLGAYLPKSVVRMDDLMAEVGSSRFKIPENYISKHIGVIEKRIADENLVPSDLAVFAAEDAINESGIDVADIDLIVYSGIARDHEEPGTAHNVQTKLGARNAVCLDVTNACLGFMTGISVADAFFGNRSVETALVCCGEKQSILINEFVKLLKQATDKTLFKEMFGMLTVGDAGGAMILQRKRSDNEGLKWIEFKSHGELSNLCYCERSAEGVSGKMIMGKIGNETLKIHEDMIPNTLDRLQWLNTDVDQVYAHQIGNAAHKKLSEITGIDPNKWPKTYVNFGNLTTATIPINMKRSPPNRGDKILFLGAGSGVSVCQGGMVY